MAVSIGLGRWALAALLLSLGSHVVAQMPEDELPPEAEATETEDDKSRPFWKNFVPIPMVITEPAIGEGLGLTLAYFHPARQSPDRQAPPEVVSASSLDDLDRSRKPPATVSGAFAAATNNGTLVAGVGHMDSFRDDHVRMTAVAAYADVVADIYLAGIPFEFNLTGTVLAGDTKVRMGESNFFWGVGANYFDATNEFRLPLPNDDPPIGLIDFDLRDVGISAKLMYDTRDNNLYPGSGQLVDLSFGLHDEALSSDYDYTTARFKALSFHPLSDRWMVGGRLQVQHVSGSPPFFAVPWVGLRGIPALRYQGQTVAAAETEARFRLSTRWSLQAFGGLGWRDVNEAVEEPDDDIHSVGLGIRFLALVEQNAWVGIDVARGPEDTYWYLQIGHPW